MNSPTSALAAGTPAKSRLIRMHALLAVQSLVVILVSFNRLGPWTLGYVLPNEFLRWVDFNNMLLLPLASLVAFYLLKKHLEANGAGTIDDGRPTTDDVECLHSRRPSSVVHRPALSAGLALNIVFIVGVYLLGASYGDHEVTNYLHARFCSDDSTSALCRIVIFNDDEFSHWVFFTGFVLVNTALMLLQVLFPTAGPVRPGDVGLLALNGLFIGAGIFANLAFEVIGLDLYVVALLAILAVGLLWRRGPQPLLIYYAIAYGVGLAGTAVYKGLRG